MRVVPAGRLPLETGYVVDFCVREMLGAEPSTRKVTGGSMGVDV